MGLRVSRFRSTLRVALAAGVIVLCHSAADAQTLTAAANPPSGGAGVANSYVTGSGFPAGAITGAVVHFGPYDLQSASLVQLNPETSSPTTLTTLQDYSFEPIQSRSGTYKQLRMAPTAPIFSTVAVKYNYALLDITGTWGFPTVPPDIRHGCIETVRSWLDKAVQDYGARDLVDLPRDIIATAAQSYDLPIAALKAVRRWQDWTP